MRTASLVLGIIGGVSASFPSSTSKMLPYYPALPKVHLALDLRYLTTLSIGASRPFHSEDMLEPVVGPIGRLGVLVQGRVAS